MRRARDGIEPVQLFHAREVDENVVIVADCGELAQDALQDVVVSGDCEARLGTQVVNQLVVAPNLDAAKSTGVLVQPIDLDS